jgi:hypothetical protein
VNRSRRWMMAAAAVGIGTGAGVRHYHARPHELNGLPGYDYQPPQPPPVVPPISMVSSLGVILLPPPPTLPPPALSTAPGLVVTQRDDLMSLQIAAPPIGPKARLKFYQFPTAGLQLDHCGISRVALVIREDGFYRLTLRADQNRRDDPTSLKTAPLVDAPIRGLPDVRLKQTGHLRRNLFIIRTRGLGSFTEPLPINGGPPTLGKPVLAQFPTASFWVQNNVPFPMASQGYLEDVAAYFDRIDRIELDFSYR